VTTLAYHNTIILTMTQLSFNHTPTHPKADPDAPCEKHGLEQCILCLMFGENKGKISSNSNSNSNSVAPASNSSMTNPYSNQGRTTNAHSSSSYNANESVSNSVSSYQQYNTHAQPQVGAGDVTPNPFSASYASTAYGTASSIANPGSSSDSNNNNNNINNSSSSSSHNAPAPVSGFRLSSDYSPAKPSPYVSSYGGNTGNSIPGGVVPYSFRSFERPASTGVTCTVHGVKDCLLCTMARQERMMGGGAGSSSGVTNNNSNSNNVGNATSSGGSSYYPSNNVSLQVSLSSMAISLYCWCLVSCGAVH